MAGHFLLPFRRPAEKEGGILGSVEEVPDAGGLVTNRGGRRPAGPEGTLRDNGRHNTSQTQ